ncbi:hypothetical protein HPB51_011842 [Rhipicephalus microplus]|uniref:C2H2-type domain-containing protein n=1 Tax=Rhipicephalus microplus TaxID=6941 RepID=A0A9J6E8Z2_RHIMP|nr:hypothetical protein HPB51_011842 [Rhipicephalus microplus]
MVKQQRFSGDENSDTLLELFATVRPGQDWHFQLNSHFLRPNQFRCHRCSRMFTRRSSLERHALIHTGDRPFRCLYCGASFALKQTLSRHILTHTGEKPHKCDFCLRTFIQRSILVRHRKKHLQEHGVVVS